MSVNTSFHKVSRHPRIILTGSFHPFLGKCLLLLGIFLLFTASPSPANAFSSLTIFSPSIKSDSVFAADLDGDGDMDLVYAEKAVWYENANGDGTVWNRRIISISTSLGNSVYASDIDGDGDIDLMSASFSDDKIAWYENTTGDGSAWTEHVISATADGFSVRAADVDGDGDTDVVSALYDADEIVWYENIAGDGSAWTKQIISTTADGAYSVYTTDVDGDGDIDIMSASSRDDKIAWYENTAGDGSAWTERIISTSADSAISVYAADVDGDGDIDIMSASDRDDKIAWYENTAGNGSAWTEHIISTSANGAKSVYAADVDGDGDIDIMSASFYDDKIAWYENTAGDGSAWTEQIISSSADSAISVYAADVDGDGDIDIISASYEIRKIAWFENNGSNGLSWTNHFLFPYKDPNSVKAADIDGDGDIDVLWAALGDGSIVWYENKIGDGSLWELRLISANANRVESISTADVDGDGDLDVLAASTTDNKIAWFENVAGDGSIWTEHVISTDLFDPRSVYAADIDGDGDLDVLAALYLFNRSGPTTDKITWFENLQGDGLSWVGHVVPNSTNSSTSINAMDIDGDGDIDIMSASYFDDKIAWYENTASDGSAWTEYVISTTADGAESVYGADVDGDGDIDIMSASYLDDKIAWYENTAGDGSAWTEHVISTTADGAKSIYAADVDGDGDIDIMSASYEDDNIFLYVNTSGTGSTWRHDRLTGYEADGANSVYAADVDEDGDLDILSASYLDGEIILYKTTTHTIDASAGAGGYIYPVGNVNVIESKSAVFNITPSPGYHIADVLVNGSSVGAVNKYTFSNITANNTIEAVFALGTNVYTITSSNHVRGTLDCASIFPLGEVTVVQGSDITFTLWKSSTLDCSVTGMDLKVNGTSMGDGLPYTFLNVTGNYNITAAFQARVNVRQPTQCGPNSPGTIFGLITNSVTGAGVAGATINAAGISFNSIPNGGYLAQLPAGIHTMTITASDYENHYSTVDIGTCSDSLMNIEMTPVGDECPDDPGKTAMSTYYRDLDVDGFGNSGNAIQACAQSSGSVANNSDCDDSDINEHPGQTWYKDTDFDGYSDGATNTVSCTRPSGYKLVSELTAISTDCDDSDINEHPGQTWYKDADFDGYSDGATNTASCTRPAGYKLVFELTAVSGECDDSDQAINPDASEVCNGVDDNCDGQIDEGDVCTIQSSPPIMLNINWNLISLSKQPANTNIETVLSSIVDKYESVWAYVNGQWKSYDPAQPNFSDLTVMETGIGYWIKMKEAGEIVVSGSNAPASISLSDGWNLVGFNGSEVKDMVTALASIAGKFISVWAYVNGQWKSYDPDQPNFSDLNNVTPGVGYWIKTNAACVWSLP